MSTVATALVLMGAACTRSPTDSPPPVDTNDTGGDTQDADTASGYRVMQYSVDSVQSACTVDHDGEVRCIHCCGDERRFEYSADASPASFVAKKKRYCVLDLDGRPHCFKGQFPEDNAVPDVRLGTIDLAMSLEFNCGLTAEGSNLVCWGPDVSQSARSVTGPFSQVAVSDGLVCVLRTDGSVECPWQSGAFYDENTHTWHYDGPPASARFREIGVTGQFGCGITTDDEMLCWGTTLLERPFASNSRPGSGLHGLATGVDTFLHSMNNFCVLDEDGYAHCEADAASVPAAELRLRSLDIGTGGGCGETLDGQFTCWGSLEGREPR